MLWSFVNPTRTCPPRAGHGRAGSAGLTLVLLLALVAPTSGCRPGAVPSAGSKPPPEAEQRAFADPGAAVRDGLSRRLGVTAALDVQGERTLGAWTFACGRPVTPNGAPINYRLTTLRPEAEDGIVEEQACVLVERTAAGYTVRELSVGATDAPFVDWPARHAIPGSIIDID